LTPRGGGRRGAGSRGMPAPPPAAAALVAGAPGPSFYDPWSGCPWMWLFQATGGPPQQPQPATTMLAYDAPPLSQPPAWALLVLPPIRSDWIADSGASYHTTPDTSILSSIRPPHPSCPSSIMVGNGSCLPVTSVGNAGTHGPFCRPNVLVAPHMVHNLLPIRQFTTDNSCSVEFDSSGLTVRDSACWCPLLRCDSSGPLYTL